MGVGPSTGNDQPIFFKLTSELGRSAVAWVGRCEESDEHPVGKQPLPICCFLTTGPVRSAAPEEAPANRIVARHLYLAAVSDFVVASTHSPCPNDFCFSRPLYATFFRSARLFRTPLSLLSSVSTRKNGN